MSFVFHFFYMGKITDNLPILPYSISRIIYTILSKTDTILSYRGDNRQFTATVCYLTTILILSTI